MPYYELLSLEQTAAADKATYKLGISPETLMENAAASVVDVILDHYEPCDTLILCGFGNNGGDGFVIARLLAEKGWNVTVVLLGDIENLKGEAALNAKRWKGTIHPFTPALLNHKALVVDALFGAGLSRPLEGEAYDIIDAVIDADIPVVAVDIPSGVDGNSGEIKGIAAPADITVTFARKKYGHLLQPARDYCGHVIVTDIGIPNSIITDMHSTIYENTPALWKNDIPIPKSSDHKYTRGAVIVMGGGIKMTGAAKLAATSALRIGAGLVTIGCPSSALSTYAASLTSVMTAPYSDISALNEIFSDPRFKTILVGPGNGITEHTKEITLKALATSKHCVLDADALTVFQDAPEQFFNAIKERDAATILTPHSGEFKRLFPTEGSKLEQAQHAAKLSGAIIIHKGSDTVIADAKGHAAINDNAPATLATAGSGDILAGIVAGLLAHNTITPFHAACMGVWMHGQAAHYAGLGMISEDLPDYIPDVLEELAANLR